MFTAGIQHVDDESLFPLLLSITVIVKKSTCLYYFSFILLN